VVLSACANHLSSPLSADTIQITAGAAPICGRVGAQDVAAKQAAAETIRRGYDKFVITNAAYQNDVHVVGSTPVVANTSGSYSGVIAGDTINMDGHSTTTVTGGDPIIMGTHDQALVVKMFEASDPAGANAVDARSSLGADWQKVVESGVHTCI
jgi:hypothetical protein